MSIKSYVAYWLECDECGDSFFEPIENPELVPCIDVNDLIMEALKDGWSMAHPTAEWYCDACVAKLEKNP